jgi:hypothetical protein
VDALWEIARVNIVQVVLRLVRAPRKGSVVVIEFSDGMHEYVTTPVKRVLRLAAKDVFYIETVNSRYRLEVRDRERALEDASSG